MEFLFANYFGFFWLSLIPVIKKTFLTRFEPLRFTLKQFSLIEIYFLVVFFFSAVIFRSGHDLLLLLKNYFSFLVFLFFFHKEEKYLSPEYLNKILRLVVRVSILEFGLINLIPITKNYFLNYSNIYSFRNYEAFYLGFYERPQGVVGQYTQTSFLLFTLFILLFSRTTVLWKLKDKLFFFFSIIIFSSGLTYIGLATYGAFLAYKNSPKTLAIFLISLTFTYIAIYYIYDINAHFHGPLIKISPQYISSVGSFKINQLTTLIKSYKNLVPLFWGNEIAIGDDFGALEIIKNLGIVGSAAYFYIIWKLCRKIVIWFLLILSLFHYSLFFSPLGNMCLAFAILFANQNCPQKNSGP